MSELENLQEQLSSWQKKVAYYKLKEASISDFEQKYNIDELIKEAEEKIIAIKEEISNLPHDDLKSPVASKLEDGDLNASVKTIQQAYQLFEELKTKLDNKSTKQELEEIENIKNKFFNEVFGEYQEKLNSIPNLSEHFISILFDRVSTSEKLENSTINDINQIRTNKEIYKSYHRSIIISALSLSLLNFKTLDPKKLLLLIDFLTDFEKEVWRRALVGIVLSLLIHQNRLVRFPDLIERLNRLQGLNEVQIGIYVIDRVIRNRLYEFVLFPEDINSHPFLANKAENWFIPFYKDNSVLNTALDKTELDIDQTVICDFLYQTPLLDSLKYIMSIALENNNMQLTYLEESKKAAANDTDGEIEDYINSALRVSYSLRPYYNIISEFFLYYKYYPKDKIVELFNSTVTISQTKLKNIILNKTQELNMSAEMHIEKEEYGSAINKLVELLNIEPNHLSALKKISECYVKHGSSSQAVVYCNKLILLDPDNYWPYFTIGKFHAEKLNFPEALNFLSKADKLKEDFEPILIRIREVYFKLKQFDNSLKILKKLIKIDPSKSGYYYYASLTYDELGMHKEELENMIHALEIEPEDVDYLVGLGSIYLKNSNFERAILLYKKAYVLGKKFPGIVFAYARALFEIGSYEEAVPILNEVLLIKSNDNDYIGVAYGNLGHIELFKGNSTKSMGLYEKCVLNFNDISEFENKFDSDLPFALRNSINEEEYMSIRSKLILFWQQSKSPKNI